MQTVKSISKMNIQKNSYLNLLSRDFLRNKYIYLMLLPVVIYYIVFYYFPMYGAVIAFEDFNPAKGILGSSWTGLKHFNDFFGSFYFLRIFKNTVLISFFTLIFGFPAPILFALLLNEVKRLYFKRIVQTVTYLPHFISTMIICGIVIDFTARNGLINYIVQYFGGENSSLLLRPELFRTIYVSSEIWQTLGWSSIIYISALSGIDPQLYEASEIDGAGKLRQAWHITLAGISPTIVILLIMEIGSIMNVGFEKIILLYNPAVYETADIISSFVYRKGLIQFDFSFSSAVGLFNSIINFILLITANFISKKVNETSLW